MSIRITLQADSADDARVVSVLAIALKDFLVHIGCSVGVVDEDHTRAEQEVRLGILRWRGESAWDRRLRFFTETLQGLRATVWCGRETGEATPELDEQPGNSNDTGNPGSPYMRPARFWCRIDRRRTTGNLCVHRSREACSFPGVCRPQPRVEI